MRQVAAVRDGLPAAEQASAVVFTSNYGEAGAVELLGAPYGLGQPVSRHNSYWDWGPPGEESATVLAVGFRSRALLDTLFHDVRHAARIDNGLGIDNEEQGAPIWICRDPVAPWSQPWPTVRLYWG